MDLNRKTRVKPLIVGNNITGNKNPSEPSAALQIDDDNGGFLTSRLTTEQRDAIPSPAIGLMIYNTEEFQHEVFQGRGWAPLGGFPFIEDGPFPEFEGEGGGGFAGEIVNQRGFAEGQDHIVDSEDYNTTVVYSESAPNSTVLPSVGEAPVGTTLAFVNDGESSVFLTDGLGEGGFGTRFTPGSYIKFLNIGSRWFPVQRAYDDREEIFLELR